MSPEIKEIEDLSLNAWPSHQIQMYDGWILRFSYLYTFRTNCVEQIGSSSLPYEEKAAYCEDVYRRWQTPCIYKVSPITDPALDRFLESCGYEKRNGTNVMTLDLADVPSLDVFAAEGPSGTDPVLLESRVGSRWLDGLFALKGTDNPVHRRIVPSMYDAIPKDEIAASVTEGGRIVATGLGILDRDYIGIYAIHVSPEHRRQGLARSICHALLAAGREKGAEKAYLQVRSDNDPAIALYSSIGFRTFYSYAFRYKEL